MSWDRPTLDQIYARIKADMESRVTSGIKIPRVSLLGILAIVFSGAMHLTYGFLQWISEQIFVDRASLWGLTRWGNILKLPRKSPSYSKAPVSFTGTNGYVVVSGTAITNNEGYVYLTQSAFTIGTTTSVEAEAEEAGAVYNTDETEMFLVNTDTDVDSVVNVLEPFETGADIEEIEDWILRLLQRFQNPPAAGKPSDYVRWALASHPAVGRAWCYDAEDWLGAGTVGVIVATSDLGEIPSGVLAEVEAYVEEQRPSPAKVDYLSANPVEVSYNISISPNTSDLQSNITTNLTNLFKLDSSPGGTVLLSRQRGAVSDASPDDYEITGIAVDSSPIGVVDIVTEVPDVARLINVQYSDI